jgi:hypothetical protein
MKRPSSKPPGFPLRLALWAAAAIPPLSACQTEDISPHQTVLSESQTDTSKGALLILFAPTVDNYADEQSRAMSNPNSTEYHLFIDGKQVLFEQSSTPFPVIVLEGGEYNGGFLEPGQHHFALTADGASPIFEGDGPIVSGAVNRLYLFGPITALQGHFRSYPFTPPDGTQHVSVINLIRAGASIEVVSCTDASSCTPVSPPLALGDTLDADLPLDSFQNSFDSESPAGGGLRFRLVPSATAPNPPLNPLYRAIELRGPTVTPPPNFIAAPIFISEPPLDPGYALTSFM